MYIKVSNGSTVMNIDDYALINKLKIYTKNEVTGVRVADLIDGENFYTMQQIHDLLEGKDGLPGYITDKQFLETLKDYILDFEILYMQTDSNIDVPAQDNVDWNKAMPIWNNQKFIWQMIRIKRDGTWKYTDPICISGAKGDTGEKGQSLVSIKPQWCLNNDGNWTDEMAIPSEYDELWMRNELTWENPDDTTYTTEVRDQVFEKIKELQSRVVKNEEDIVAINEEIELLKEEDTTIKEELDLRATKEELQEVIDYDNSNLLKNGDFYYGTKHWMVYGTGMNIPRLQSKPEYPHGNAFMIQGEISHVQYIEQPTYPITNVEESVYTLSCMVQSDDAQDGFDMPLCGLKIEVYYPDKTMDEFISEVEITDGTWNKLHLTIELNRVVEHFECDFYVRDTSKTIRVSEMMFTQGKIVGPFNPSQKEVFDNIYELLENMNSNNSNNNNSSVDIDLSNYALIEDIPVKLSELENDMDYLVEVPEEYITEEELENKNYLTEHQSLEGLATENYVNNKIAEAQLSGGDTNVDLSGYATTDYVDNAIDGIELQKGDKGDKGDKGEDGITPNISIGSVTVLEAGQKAYVTRRGADATPTFDFGIPKGDKGEDGSSYDDTELRDSISTLTNNKADKDHTHDQYLTEHQDISHLALKEDIPSIDNLATEEFVKEEIAKLETPEINLDGLVTKEELTEAKYVSYYDLYLQDENGDYINDKNDDYIIEEFASKASIEDLQNQINELNLIIKNLQNQIDELNSN